jgi:hypothetical protein
MVGRLQSGCERNGKENIFPCREENLNFLLRPVALALSYSSSLYLTDNVKLSPCLIKHHAMKMCEEIKL